MLLAEFYQFLLMFLSLVVSHAIKVQKWTVRSPYGRVTQSLFMLFLLF